MVEIPEEFVAALEGLTPAARVDLLHALISPGAVRLDRIRRLFERDDTREVAELLIDLEGNRWARSLMIDALRNGQASS
jgi:hypothetical protein